jgi:hypothetical protein
MIEDQEADDGTVVLNVMTEGAQAIGGRLAEKLNDLLCEQFNIEGAANNWTEGCAVDAQDYADINFGMVIGMASGFVEATRHFALKMGCPREEAAVAASEALSQMMVAMVLHLDEDAPEGETIQ